MAFVMELAVARCAFTSMYVLLWLLEECEAAASGGGRGRSSPKRRGAAKHERMSPEERVDEIVTVVQYMFVLVIAPVVIKFLYQVATDPDVPLVIREVKCIVCQKFTCYLGQRQQREERNE